MKRILLIDSVHEIFIQSLQKAGFELVDGQKWSRKKILQELKNFQGIALRSRITIDKEFIDAASNLKFLARVGAGMESIDVEYAKSKKIQCFNSPEGNRDAVAEHALGLLLSIMNNLSKADREIRNGAWNRESNRGTELGGKTIGLIGYGNTGKAFAKRLSSFNVKVIAYDKYKKKFSDKWARACTLNEIYTKADVISFHIPLSDETHFMFDLNFIDSVKKNFYLINTSRGKVVHTESLVSGLMSGKILGAGLDVNEYEDSTFEQQNLSSNIESMPQTYQYLLTSDHVLLTPHVAGWTHESKIKLAEVLVQKILKFYKIK